MDLVCDMMGKDPRVAVQESCVRPAGMAREGSGASSPLPLTGFATLDESELPSNLSSLIPKCRYQTK